MPQVSVVTNALADTRAAVVACLAGLRQELGREPEQVVVAVAERHPLALVQQLVAEAFPAAAVHGVTSCLGVTDRSGLIFGGLGLLGIADPAGAYGTACGDDGGSPRFTARTLARQAVANQTSARQASAQQPRAEDRPRLVLVTATPGHEESVLAGIEDAVGHQVPIFGGSAGDDRIAGRWQVCGGGVTTGAGVSLSAWSPSCRLVTGFAGPHRPTLRRGIVTRADGRCIETIDDQPAAQWYDQGLGGRFADLLAQSTHQRCRGGTILAGSTLSPLGRIVSRAKGGEQILLSHPERITPEGHLTLFTEVLIGEEVVLMQATDDDLVGQTGPMVAEVLAQAPATRPLGALLVYCAGTLLAVRGRMAEVAANVDQRLAGAPFLGIHTFGEQGRFVGSRTHHGNLMLAMVALVE